MGLRSWWQKRQLKKRQREMEEEIIAAAMEASKRERTAARHRMLWPTVYAHGDQRRSKGPNAQAIQNRKETITEVDHGTPLLGQMLSVPAVSYDTETPKAEPLTTPDPSPAYDGFGGGESGGGGASGSWDSGSPSDSGSSYDSGSSFDSGSSVSND